MTAQPFALRVSGLSAGYGDNTVLNALSLAIPKDENTGIVGPGGSGKSTLLRALSNNEEIVPEHFWCRWERRSPSAGPMPFMSQRPRPESRTVGELLRRVEGGPDAIASFVEEFWRCAPEASHRLIRELDASLASAPFDIVRLAEFTAAVANSEDSLLLDEPDGNLKEESRLWIAAKLQAIRGYRTAVIVTHHLEFARDVTDSVMLLVKGDVLETGRTEQFFGCPSHPRTRQYIRLGR